MISRPRNTVDGSDISASEIAEKYRRKEMPQNLVYNNVSETDTRTEN